MEVEALGLQPDHSRHTGSTGKQPGANKYLIFHLVEKKYLSTRWTKNSQIFGFPCGGLIFVHQEENHLMDKYLDKYLVLHLV